MSDAILQLKSIRHSYDSIPALDGVDFDLFPGEVHAITGDHRSGKSTLVHLLSGDVRKQQGTILIHGKEIPFLTHESAMQHGIGIVRQNSTTFRNMTAVDNIYAGHFPKFLIRNREYRKMMEHSRKLLESMNLSIDIRKPVGSFSLREQQMVEIARAVHIGREILIFDEVAQRLTPFELEQLTRVFRTAKKSGKAIIYVTSNIEEVFNIADRVTVLKNGHRRGTESVQKVERSRLINLAFSFAMNEEVDTDTQYKMLLLSQYDEAVMNNLPVGMILLDRLGTIFFMNNSAHKILNIDHDSVMKRPIGELLTLLGLEEKDEILAHILSREQYSNSSLTFNSEKVIKITSYPLKDRENTILGTTVLIEDVSIDYVTREYLTRAEKVASTAELGAGVAHEINNPLGIIKNYLLLLKVKTMDDEAREYLGHIESELNRIVETVGSLLSFSRVNQSPFRTLTLSKLIDEILMLLGHKLNKKHITVSRHYRHADAVVYGSENKLKQLFINLITNSIEAMLDRGKIEIRIEKSKADNYVEATITDNGNGIPLDIQGDIFTPFFSTKMTRTNTGLGLSICQHIVESHKGIITFKSIPGEFTSFTVRFPTVTRTGSANFEQPDSGPSDSGTY